MDGEEIDYYIELDTRGNIKTLPIKLTLGVLMYEDIINEIKSNLGENPDLNKQYLSLQIEKYSDHPYTRRSSHPWSF